MAPRIDLERRVVTVLSIAALSCGAAGPVMAQGNPAPIVEAVVGRSGFIDEVWDHFTTIGGGARAFATPRLAIGPEVALLRGEFDARDASNLIVTANITFDFVRDDRRARFVPYLAAGGGYLRQKTVVGSGPADTTLRPFTSSEGTVSAGAGMRIGIAPRVFIAPEFRLGWEPETRIAVMIGMRTR